MAFILLYSLFIPGIGSRQTFHSLPLLCSQIAYIAQRSPLLTTPATLPTAPAYNAYLGSNHSGLSKLSDSLSPSTSSPPSPFSTSPVEVEQTYPIAA